ncbi:ABC transporter substrate-binding protein [Paraburkholderia sp. EG287A]|uniref:ABC transporter substrate-binding protein n=1 Tax=unclassified Paraburkholderia TaxID=2615204 RepID=UPI0034D1FA0B
METKSIRVMWFVPPLLAMVASLEAPAVVVDGRRNRSSDEQFEALVAGEVDAVVTSMDNVIGWNRRPGPGDFRVVAQVEQTTPLTLVSHPRLRRLHELRGSNLLVDAPDNGFVVALRAMLRDAGLESDAFQLTPAGGVKERFDALLAGVGDATLLGPPFDAMAIQAGLERMITVQEQYPAFPGQGVVVRAGSSARASVQGWVRALEKARRDVLQNPELARRAVTGAGLPLAVADTMIVLNPVTLRPTPEGIALLVAHRKSLNLEGADNDYSTIVDDSMVKELIGGEQ